LISDVKQLTIKRIIIFGILGSLLKPIFYITTTFILWHLIAAFYKFRGDWETFVWLSVPLFGFLVFFQNIVIEIINKKWNVILLFIFFQIIYVVGWGEDYNGWPINTILILTTGLPTLLLKFIFDLNFKNLKCFANSLSLGSKIVNLQS
jgi:hypothetical protein